MSADRDDSDIADAVDKRTDKAKTEVHEAVVSILGTVDAAATAADEGMDVALETKTVLRHLSAGKRMAAAEAAIEVLDDDTRAEADEALAAVRDVQHEADAAFGELVDVADVISDAAVDLSDGMMRVDLPLGDLDSIGDAISAVLVGADEE